MAETIRRLIFEAFWEYPSRLAGWQIRLVRLSAWPLRNRVMPILFPKGPVLDLGCGNGQRLLELQEYGHNELYGVEVSEASANYAKSMDGMHIYQGELEDAAYPAGFFSLVTANQVLEHVPFPKDTLEEIHRILGDDGLIYLTVPNFGSVESKIFLKEWHALCLPTHLYHFTPKTLQKTLDAAEFKIMLCRTDSLFEVTEASLRRWSDSHTGTLACHLVGLIPGVVKRFMVFLADLAGQGNMIRIVAMKKAAA